MQLKPGLRSDIRVAGRFCGRKRHTATIISAEHVQKCVVQSMNKRSVSSEIGSQLEGVENEPFIVSQFEAAISHAREQLWIRVAERVNGLHRVTDQEDGATVLIAPRRHEAAEKLILASTRVLELVDQEVANVISGSECDLRGEFIFVLKHLLCDLSYFSEIDDACLGKDGSQVARCLAQQCEACLDDLPIFVRVACRGKTANPMKGWRPNRESLRVPQSNRESASFSCLRSGGNPRLISICLRKRAIVGEQQLCQTHVGTTSLFKVIAVRRMGRKGTRRVRQDPNVARRRSMRRQTSRVHEPRQLRRELDRAMCGARILLH